MKTICPLDLVVTANGALYEVDSITARFLWARWVYPDGATLSSRTRISADTVIANLGADPAKVPAFFALKNRHAAEAEALAMAHRSEIQAMQ